MTTPTLDRPAIHRGAAQLRALFDGASIPAASRRTASGRGTRASGYSVQWRDDLDGWLVTWWPRDDAPAEQGALARMAAVLRTAPAFAVRTTPHALVVSVVHGGG